MKKYLIVFTLIILASASLNAKAQGMENNLRKEILARKIIDISLQDENIIKMIESMSYNYINTIKTSYSQCLNEAEFEKFRQDFSRDSQSALKDIVLENKDSITSIYINLFSEKELEEVISFMQSDIYKKINTATPMFQQMIMVHLQTAITNNQDKIREAINEELKKQGKSSCEAIPVNEQIPASQIPSGENSNDNFEEEI